MWLAGVELRAMFSASENPPRPLGPPLGQRPFTSNHHASPIVLAPLLKISILRISNSR